METAGGGAPPDDLSQIVTPPTAPAKDPDAKTKRESEAANAAKLTPTDHDRVLAVGYRAMLDQERLPLLAENTRLHQKLERAGYDRSFRRRLEGLWLSDEDRVHPRPAPEEGAPQNVSGTDQGAAGESRVCPTTPSGNHRGGTSAWKPRIGYNS